MGCAIRLGDREVSVKVEDEFGTCWLVLSGDAAYPLTRLLNSLNYDWIILPRRMLCGIMPASPEQEPQDLVRSTRLADCLAAVNKGD